MDIITIIIAVVGGFLAGIVNTLAGNGSAITLSILTEVIGLPANIANGTNRIGILFQTWASSVAFIKNDRIYFSASRHAIIFSTIGSLIGVYTAISVSNDQFATVFKYLLLVMLVVILIKPKRWLRVHTEKHAVPTWVSAICFLGLGFYGGFIQMGMGVIFLAVTVLIMKYNIIDANALKTFIIAIYTTIIIFIFHYNGMIDWKVGSIVAIGQATGGYLAAAFASNYKGIEIWAYRLLIAVVILAILSAFDVVGF